MYEVGETNKDHHYRDKLLFVVLSENERKYYGDNMPEKVAPNHRMDVSGIFFQYI